VVKNFSSASPTSSARPRRPLSPSPGLPRGNRFPVSQTVCPGVVEISPFSSTICIHNADFAVRKKVSEYPSIVSVTVTGEEEPTAAPSGDDLREAGKWNGKK
jgi:hypothetical protein